MTQLVNAESNYFLSYRMGVAFGDRVKTARLLRRMQSQELATAIGVKPPVVSRWESKKQGPPQARTLVRLSKALDCSIDYLMELTDQPRADPTHKKNEKAVTYSGTRDEVQQALTPATGGSQDVGSSSASRVLEERYQAFISGAIAAARRIYDIADALRDEGDDLTGLAAGSVPPSRGPGSQSPESHRARPRSGDSRSAPKKRKRSA